MHEHIDGMLVEVENVKCVVLVRSVYHVIVECVRYTRESAELVEGINELLRVEFIME